MTSPYLSRSEHILLSADRVYVTEGLYEVLLTNRRIILIDNAGARSLTREIPLVTVLSLEPSEADGGEPAITLSVVTARGAEAVEPVDLIFCPAEGELRARERNQWREKIEGLLPGAREHARGLRSASSARPDQKRSRPTPQRRIERVRPHMLMAVHAPFHPTVPAHTAEAPGTERAESPPPQENEPFAPRPAPNAEETGRAAKHPSRAAPAVQPADDSISVEEVLLEEPAPPAMLPGPEPPVLPWMEAAASLIAESSAKKPPANTPVPAEPLPEEGRDIVPAQKEPTVPAPPARAGTIAAAPPPHREMPPPAPSPGIRRYIVPVTVILIVLAGLLLFPYLPAGPGYSLPAAPPASPPPTPAPTEEPSSPAGAEKGVWVQVECDSRFTGWIGNPGMLRPVSGTGLQRYQIIDPGRLVEISVQKEENSGDILSVAIIRNGTTVASRTTRVPMGAIEVLIDPSTGLPPGM
jgi:hypothetical protein